MVHSIAQELGARAGDRVPEEGKSVGFRRVGGGGFWERATQRVP